MVTVIIIMSGPKFEALGFLVSSGGSFKGSCTGSIRFLSGFNVSS